MLRRSGAFLLALLALTPSALAFPSAQEELAIAYSLGNTPTMVSAGALFLDGTVRDGLVIAGSQGTVFDRIPELRIVDRSKPIELNVSFPGATIELATGAMVWTFPSGKNGEIATSESYAVAIALPEAPIPREDNTPSAGFILASERVSGTITWRDGESLLVPLDAIVTVRDATGDPIRDWNGRRVNPNANAQDDPDGLQIVFFATGGFTTRIAANVVGGATGADEGLRLVIGPSEEDRFSETAQVFSEATSGMLTGAREDVSNPLEIFEPVSGLLNGAIIVVPGAGGGQTPEPVLLASTFGGEEFPLGPFNLIRGDDLELAWDSTRMEVSGEPSVALGRDGFGVNEPVAVGIFPIVSIVLWLLALGAVVFFFVKRPPKAKGPITLRLASIGLYLIVLLITFILWDKSFADSFGTSALRVMRSEGVGSDSIATIGILFALELVPWSIASLLFALPVRIGAGVGLRYLGRGKSFKGVAGAAGLVSLAIFGPIYALWCFNFVWSRVSAAMPSVGG